MKTTGECEYFSCFGSMIKNYARCTREIKSRIAMTKAAFDKNQAIFTSKLDLNFRKKLGKCYVWCIALYDRSLWRTRIGRSYRLAVRQSREL